MSNAQYENDTIYESDAPGKQREAITVGQGEGHRSNMNMVSVDLFLADVSPSLTSLAH